MKIEFLAWYGDTSFPVELNSVSGTGQITYRIYIRRSYHGTITKKEGKWVATIQRTMHNFSTDDLQILADMVERAENEKS